MRVSSLIGKFVAMLIVGKTITPSIPLMQRLLAGVAAVLVLALIASMLTGVLIVGGLYFAYELLVGYGLEPQAALLTVGGLTLLLIIAMFGGAIAYARSMRGAAIRLMAKESPVAYGAKSIANAFIDGFSDQRLRA